MTTITPAAPELKLRLTRRGRRVVVTAVVIASCALVAIVGIGGGSALASHAPGAPAGTFQTVTVHAGESLWIIAERVAPHADLRDVVDDIIDLNALGSATVHPGQTLSIPSKYTQSK